MSEGISLENSKLLKKQVVGTNPTSEMLYGTYGVWHVGPSRNTKDEKRDIVPTKPHEKAEHIGLSQEEKWFYLIPIMQGMWRERDQNSQTSSADGQKWKGGMGHHGMDSKKFQEILSKMKKVREERSKDNSCDSPFNHKHGFCKRMFTAVGKDGDEKRPNSKFWSKHLDIFHQV